MSVTSRAAVAAQGRFDGVLGPHRKRLLAGVSAAAKV